MVVKYKAITLKTILFFQKVEPAAKISDTIWIIGAESVTR